MLLLIKLGKSVSTINMNCQTKQSHETTALTRTEKYTTYYVTDSSMSKLQKTVMLFNVINKLPS